MPKQPVSDKVSFKDVRNRLHLSQTGFAKMLGMAAKTAQGWEQGRPIPKSILILVGLIRDMPAVRMRLLPEAFAGRGWKDLLGFWDPP